MSDQMPSESLEPDYRLVDPEKVADEFGIKSLGVVDGVPTLTTEPTSEQARALVLEMCLALGKMLDDDEAPNYVEFEVSPAGHPGYVVHVRRAIGQTPHALRKKAEARVAELEERLREVEQERDLAVAHDRQPYPTAWAYEQACAALEKHRKRADTAEGRIAELEAQLREEGNTVGRLQDQLRTACTEGADARARAAELEWFVADLAAHGLRCDLNPTVLNGGTYEWWSDYLRAADKSIRDRARAVMGEIGGQS